MDQYQVSISASIDLPLFLHEKYRVDKNGASTLARMEANLRLLAQYPHRKKLSCVVTQEHCANLDAFIQYIHLNTYTMKSVWTWIALTLCLALTPIKTKKIQWTPKYLQMLSEAQQVDFYQRLKQAFAGTALEAGFARRMVLRIHPWLLLFRRELRQ